MDKEQPQFPKDFFKQFKSKEDFQSFFTDLYKQGVEEMLKGELDEHLGYEKHSKEGHNTGNSRNGSYPKKVKTESLGDLVLNIPRDRKSDFEPQLIPKGQRMSDKLEEAIIGMCSRGMTTSDISEQVKQAYGVDTAVSLQLAAMGADRVRELDSRTVQNMFVVSAKFFINEFIKAGATITNVRKGQNTVTTHVVWDP